MKKIFVSLFVLAISLNSFSQNTLSPAERKLLIEELRREILDSLRAPSAVVTTDDSLKAENAKPWKGSRTLSAYIEAY